MLINLKRKINGTEAMAVDEAVSLDSCRAMAMANNKQMRIQAERIKAAGYQKKEAFAAYLPSIRAESMSPLRKIHYGCHRSWHPWEDMPHF